MPPKTGRRGVLVTATARKSRRLEDAPAEDSDEQPAGSDKEVQEAKASQLEWEEIEREVREEKRRLFADREFTAGRRGDVAVYDDVAADFDESAEAPDRPEAVDAAGEAQEVEADGARDQADAGAAVTASTDGERPLPPEGAVTAGQEPRVKKRGGKKLAKQKRKREEKALADAEEGQEAEAKRRQKAEEEEEEAKRWLRLKLEGMEKPKRIKAARVVYYYDHDSSGALFPKELPSASTAEPTAEAAQAPAGNFRAGLRRDLFEEESDEEG